MNTPRANHSAFPIYSAGDETYYGLTIREYFAAAALQGLLIGVYPLAEKSKDNREVTAAWAVAFADALIAELEKTKPQI